MDLDSPELPTLFRKTVLKGDFDPSTKLESTQVFVTSNDGTRVPMFIISPRGTLLDGSNPTLLYGYGGEIKDSDLAERERERRFCFSRSPFDKGKRRRGLLFFPRKFDFPFPRLSLPHPRQAHREALRTRVVAVARRKLDSNFRGRRSSLCAVRALLLFFGSPQQK